jgi:hypothetical protein
MNGIIDEVRVSTVARSTEWIQAEFCTAGGVVSGTGPAQYPAVTSAVAEIAPNAVAAGSTGNAFTYDILPAVGASDTGVNQVVITAPAGYANFNVTAVSLDGTGKSASGTCPNPAAGEYCASIAGQDITVTLGDQGGNGQVIQVVFEADAPGTAGSADFSATVDDTATAVAAQATNTGNADGDGADNNSRTVTVNATAALSGTVTDDSETDIRAGGSTIILTLTGDTWVAAGAAFDAQRQNIIDGLDSARAEAAGWDAVVKTGLAVTDVVRTSDTVVTVTLPAFDYHITATETITATVPATAVAGGSAIVAAPTFDVVAITAALSGTVTDDIETDIRTGGSTIILTLTGTTWIAGGGFNLQRQAIIDALISAQAEAAGWNAEVQPNIAAGDVVRTSDTVVTITLPAVATYDITATETIYVMIPASAIVCPLCGTIFAAPTFNIAPISAALSGTVIDDSETDIRTGGSTLILTLTNDTWVADGATFNAQRQNIIDGLDSAQAEAAGWDAVVKAGLTVTDVVRTSDTVVTVTLPAFGAYDITATEFITATIPATAVAYGSAIVATPTFDVTTDPSWYDGNWPYRKKIDLDGANFCTTVNAFPVPVILSGDADLQAAARADGFDILFTAADGVTKLPHEIETFTQASGDLVAWVKLNIVSGADQSLYMYYGNSAAADQQDLPGLWDADFVGVWHLKEDGDGTADEFIDSSGNSNHGQGGSGTPGNIPTQTASGKIGYAQCSKL